MAEIKCPVPNCPMTWPANQPPKVLSQLMSLHASEVHPVDNKENEQQQQQPYKQQDYNNQYQPQPQWDGGRSSPVAHRPSYGQPGPVAQRPSYGQTGVVVQQPTYGQPGVIVQQPSAVMTGFPVKMGWRTGVLDCFDNIGVCLLGCCCYYCLGAWVSINLGESVFLPCCVRNYLGVLRAQFRTQQGIEGTVMEDCIFTTFCSACVLCQLKREMDSYKSMGTLNNPNDPWNFI